MRKHFGSKPGVARPSGGLKKAVYPASAYPSYSPPRPFGYDVFSANMNTLARLQALDIRLTEFAGRYRSLNQNPPRGVATGNDLPSHLVPKGFPSAKLPMLGDKLRAALRQRKAA